MLTPPSPAGMRCINSQPWILKPTVAENDVSVTITLPVALPWYKPDAMCNWNAGHPYIISQTQTTCVLGFPTPAPAGAEVLVAIFG